MVEHILGKDEVTGSIPVASSPESLAGSIVRFEKRTVLIAGVTQLVESQPSKLLVAGSSPVSRSITKHKRFK